MNKTEEFINKAIEIHGDKYDYSKVEYRKAINKVIIICIKHGEFNQTPNSHLYGYGCKKCGIEKNIDFKKSNNEEFIKKAIDIHGNNYDYSKVNYKKSKEKIIIICKIHGEFNQTPSDHLSNHGCKKCGIEQNANNCRSNNEEFIKKAKLIHCDKYDYSKSVYTNSNTKIIIICREHGDFFQIPYEHLSGKGCKYCAIENNSNKLNSNTCEFIKKAIGIHGNKYDYSKVNYKKAQEKVLIICRNHGEFEQRACSHLNGNGCKICGIEQNANNKKYDNLSFIEKATYIHKNKYDYTEVKYINSQIKIIIICKNHGKFEQVPSKHLQGVGCNYCAIEDNTDKLKSNTYEFINKAKQKYGDKYNYSKVDYINSRTKVIIICKEHGNFMQRPNDHLSGYGCYKCNAQKQYSNKQIEWLNFLSLYYNINIQHAENEGEYKIPETNYKADGYCKETNTIFEYDGDFFHGNPEIYDENDYNKLCKKTFGELYLNTLEKELKIISMGYKLKKIWDSEWIKINKSIAILQKKFKKCTK